MKSTDSKAAVVAEKRNSIKEKPGALYWDSRKVLEAKTPPNGSNLCSFYDRRELELRMHRRGFSAPQNQPHRSMIPQGQYTEAHANVVQEGHAPS